MTLWRDAHLSPALATWISETLDVTCNAVRELGLRDASDGQIFRWRIPNSAAIHELKKGVA